MWQFSLSSNVTEKKIEIFGGIGYLQASIRCYERGNMWSVQRFLKWSRNSSLARLCKEAILPLSVLWISKSTHCTEIQPWCSQHEEARSRKCSQNIVTLIKWWPFPWVTKEIVSTCGRGPCPIPAAYHTETETKVRCTKMRPRRMGSAYWRVTRRWKLWRRSGSRFKCLDW